MIKWNEYTWYSRLAALIVFILLLPILTFYLGVQYQKTADVLSLSANAPLPAGNYSNSGGSIPVTIVTSTTTSTTTVITTTSKPQINSLNPSSGSAGTEVTISGLNFDRNSNQITFGSSNGRHHPDGSADNKTLTFTVPASGPSGILCSSARSCIGISALRLTSGTYPVSVINKNGTSNVVQFSLTE